MGKIYDIKKFGRKLMVSSASVNNTPDEYMSLSQNARIYDGGIGPRRGKQILFESSDGFENRGGFSVGSSLFQVSNKKIYKIDTKTGERIEKGAIDHDSVVDVTTYQFPKGNFSSLGTITQSSSSVLNKYIEKERIVQIAPIQFKTNYIIDILHKVSWNGWLYFPDGESRYRMGSMGDYYTLGVSDPRTGTPIYPSDYSYSFSGKELTFSRPVPDYAIIYLSYSAIRGVGAVKYIKSSNSLQLWTDDKTELVGFLAIPAPIGGYTFSAVAIHSPYGGLSGSTGHYNQSDSKYYLYDQEWTTFGIGNDQTSFSITYDYGHYTTGEKAIMLAENQTSYVFDGETLSIIDVPYNNGFVEFGMGRTFIAAGNVLYMSSPITLANPERAYDFTGSGSQNIQFETKITGLKNTMGGLYIFTENSVEVISPSSIQNVSGSTALVSTRISKAVGPLSNSLIVSSVDKVFWLTKYLNVQQLSFMQGTQEVIAGELSSKPIIGVRELLQTINNEQTNAFAWYNENEKTANWSVKQSGSGYNNYVITYDTVYDTWNVDTGKNYSSVVMCDNKYYGFSSINSNVYIDGEGYSDVGTPIEFKIITNSFSLGTFTQKLFDGFHIFGAIGPFTSVEINAIIDAENIFNDKILGDGNIETSGDIGGEIGGVDIGDMSPAIQSKKPFYMRADAGRIYRCGRSISFEIKSNSTTQDFIIDKLGFSAQVVQFTDITNKF